MDAAVVFEIQRASALAGFKHIFPPERYPFPDEAEHRSWRGLLQAPDVDVVVAEREGRSCGVVAVAGDELLRLFIVPNEWGGGIAGALHDVAVDLLRSRGATTGHLWVLEDNPRARRFYERRGWKFDGRRKEGSFPPFPPAVGYSRVINELCDRPHAPA